MKWVIVTVGVIAAALLAFYFFKDNSLQSVTNYPPEGSVIVAYGDSLVEGVGATAGNDFVSVLSRNIGVPIENLGVGGNTSELGLIRIDEVLKRDPDIVLLLLGGNDYLRRLPRDETLQNLGNIITRLHEAGSVVVLLGVRGGVLRDNFKKNFKDLAKEHNTAYVPNVLDGLIGKSEFMYDTIHPNDRGHALIAAKIEPILRELIAQ